MFKRSQPGRPLRTLGIELGGKLRAVQLEKTEEGPVVSGWESDDLPGDAIKDGVIVNRREAAGRLRQMLVRFANRPQAATLSLPIEQVYLRWIDLPLLKPDALIAATEFEARKYL